MKAKHMKGCRATGLNKVPCTCQPSATYGVSTIELGGKMSFIGKNRRLSPTFTHWWNGLCRTLSAGPGTRCENPPPNIEAAHKAYMANTSISSYAAELDVIQSVARHRLENEALNTLHARVSPKIGAPQYPKGKRSLEDIAQNMEFDDLVSRRRQNDDLIEQAIGRERRARLKAENAAIVAELQRREAQHSVDLRNRITGQDPRLKITRDALVSKLLDTARRLDRELAQLRQDLDRLRSFD